MCPVLSSRDAKSEIPFGGHLKTCNDKRRFKNFYHAVKTCDDKRRFENFCHAVQAADQLMEERALVLNPIVPYKCRRHGCFHIGHNRWMDENNVRIFTMSSRFRTRITFRSDDLEQELCEYTTA